MKPMRISPIFALFMVVMTSASGAQQSQPPGPQVVDLKSPDGTLLKATYFAAGKPGPGMLLFHQSNRNRTSWDELARQLAVAGINTLAVDTRGYGQSGGTRREANQPQTQQADLETAFQFLASQPGVKRDVIGSAGTGWVGHGPARHGEGRAVMRAARQPSLLPKEVETHIAVADALEAGCVPGWLWSHFPAGEHRDERTGALLKKMGLKRGWPDFILISPAGTTYWLELKRGPARLTRDQEAFAATMQARGVPWAVARSTEEAIRVLRLWGALRLRVSA